jgi:subtilisin family serine protease
LLLIAGLGAGATVVQSCCQIADISEAESLAVSNLDSCAANHAKGQMSVSVSSRAAQLDNQTLQSLWSGALKTFVKPSVFSVKSVESATGDADSVRYLTLDGRFGRGLGVGRRVLSRLFKEGGSGSGLLGVATMSNIQESLEVKAPAPKDESIFQNVSGFSGLEKYLNTNHPDGDVASGVDYSSMLFADYDPNEQWAPKQMRYDEAVTQLKAAADSANPTRVVRVAVLDTGIDVDHPDLKDVIDRELAYNALSGKSGASEVADAQGHGTHVAGIIAGQGIGKSQGLTSNVLGVAGKFRVKIVPIKVLGDDGSGSTTAINRGIRWAMQKQVDIISMSLGGGSNYECVKDQSLKDPVIQEAIDKGIIVIAAAGNEGCPLGGSCTSQSPDFTTYTVLPCSNEGVLCVASNDNQEAPSSFSNYALPQNEQTAYRIAPDIVAPGSRILSTYPRTAKFANYNGVAVLSGTSMATPYVSGIAAILKLTETADYPVNQETLKKYLQEASFKDSIYEEKFRAGRVDLQALMKNRQDKYVGKTTSLVVAGSKNPVPYEN